MGQRPDAHAGHAVDDRRAAVQPRSARHDVGRREVTLERHRDEDPHGDPIPDRMGRVRTVPAIPLTEVEQGQQVIIARLSVHDPDLVRYVAALGLVPGVVVRVATRTVYGDVLTLQIGESSVTVGNVVASQLLVHAVEEGREASSR